MQSSEAGIDPQSNSTAAVGISARAKEKEKVRAWRFTMEVPVHYRLLGEEQWRRGETRNISSSGVLFRGEQAVNPGALVEMRLKMLVTSSEGAVEMECRAMVIRVAQELEPVGDFEVAARIVHCRWARP